MIKIKCIIIFDTININKLTHSNSFIVDKFISFSTGKCRFIVIMVSFIGGGNQNARRKPPNSRKSHIILFRMHLSEFELRTSVVIHTECIGSYNLPYHHDLGGMYMSAIFKCLKPLQEKFEETKGVIRCC